MSNYTIFVEKKKCLTPVCRGGYVNILESRALPGDEEKLAWGMQCMFPKDGEGVAEWVNDLKKIYVQVLIDKFGQEKAKEMAGVISKKRKFPLRDGDDPSDTDGLANVEQLEVITSSTPTINFVSLISLAQQVSDLIQIRWMQMTFIPVHITE